MRLDLRSTLIWGCAIAVLIFFNSIEISWAAPCGNGVCQSSQSETCNTCPTDCGQCPNPPPTSEPSPQPTDSPGGDNSGDSGGGSSSGSSGSSSGGEAAPVIVYYPKLGLTSSIPAITNSSTIFVQGFASIDDGSVRRVEYSITAGAEWLPTAFNGSSFSTNIGPLADGNYGIILRAVSDKNIFTQSQNYITRSVTIATRPPEINIDDPNPKPTNDTSPVITGSVTTFTVNLARLEYSLDQGETWTRMPTTSNFELELPELTDGNYQVLIRATDQASNQTTSDEVEIIIDTIPPTYGGATFSAGRQNLGISNYSLEVYPSTPAEIHLSLNGGVTQAQVNIDQQNFDLTPKAGNRIWEGVFADLPVGLHQPKLTAIDGAGNEVLLDLPPIKVKEPFFVVDNNNQEKIDGVKMTVYYFDPIFNSPVIWDGGAYGQENPNQITDQGFGVILPKGRYYIEFNHPQYRRLQTNIFEVPNTSLISFPVQMNRNQLPNLLTNLWPDQMSLGNLTGSETDEESVPWLGERPGDFEFLGLEENSNFTSDNLSPNTLIIFSAPWSADSQELLSFIDSYLAENQEKRSQIKIIFPHESPSSAIAFLGRGNYDLPIYTDPTATNSASLQLLHVPQLIWIDENLTINQVEFDSKSISELLENLN